MRFSLRFKKEIVHMNLLINDKGHLCDLHHNSIVDGRKYTTLTVAERTQSHYGALASKVGHITAEHTANIASMFNKGHKIVWSNEK